ncbi:nitroreductase family protein [Saccharopolyspora sp. K220]|uniref:nitroreductase family protein n=1 Tax=Saccharopolyspora soli TaxID=2926618 RepID=UPI001F574988|nr:nitroreductase family protein [Saccharopolyspora soli]MCI2422534.1 nitroreductase family protein [Saccharopolyspora soli]
MNPVTTIEDALLTRRSCRAFLPTPVPRAEVERLLDLAARSASNSNCQPWQVHVLTGAAKRALTEDLLRAHDPRSTTPTWRGGRTRHDRRMGGPDEESGMSVVSGTVTAEHWFDFICPFCYVAQDRNQVLREHGIHVVEHALQIHPEIGPGGTQVGPRSGPTYEFLAREAEAAGLPLRWTDRICCLRRSCGRHGNSLHCQRNLRWLPVGVVVLRSYGSLRSAAL